MNKNTTASPALIALRLAEERACAGYLAAHKAMVRLAARTASLGQLAAQQPMRADYRAAWHNAVTGYSAATERTRLAWTVWNRAQLRYDAAWTATAGRTLRGVPAWEPAA